MGNQILKMSNVVPDPIKTARGFLSIKAYRLTPEAINIVQERDYTPEALKKGRLGFETLFQEIRLVIKNSHLVNTLLTELYEVSFILKHEFSYIAH